MDCLPSPLSGPNPTNSACDDAIDVSSSFLNAPSSFKALTISPLTDNMLASSPLLEWDGDDGVDDIGVCNVKHALALVGDAFAGNPVVATAFGGSFCRRLLSFCRLLSATSSSKSGNPVVAMASGGSFCRLFSFCRLLSANSGSKSPNQGNSH